MKASELSEEVELVSTPIPLLNEILGGGIPTRLITEIAGPPGCGKTTLALQVLAQAQRFNKPAYYADAERILGFKQFAGAAGVDLENLDYDKQRFAEDLLQNLVEWSSSKKNGVIVVDSVGALHGREEAEKDIEAKSIGIQSRMIAKFCRVLTPIIDENNHVLIMVNHLYTDPISSALKSSGGAKLDYHKGLALWLKPAYGKSPKRSSDGTKTVKFIEAEIRNKAKYPSAFDGRKVILELIPKQGFVGEFVAPPTRRKRSVDNS